VHAESTGELIIISFQYIDHSVESLDSEIAHQIAERFAESKRKTTTFWLVFGLSLNMGLSERLIQNVKWAIILSPKTLY